MSQWSGGRFDWAGSELFSDGPTDPVPADMFGAHFLAFNDRDYPSNVNFENLRAGNAGALIGGDFLHVSWTDIHTAEGVFDWSPLDLYDEFCRTNGLKYFIVLSRDDDTWVGNFVNDAEQVKTHWTAWINALMSYLAGLTDGSQCDSMGTWNEPNGSSPSAITPEFAAELAAIAYPLIKAADSSILVAAPSPQGNGIGWATSYEAEGGYDDCDVIPLHLYGSATQAGQITWIESYQALFAANNITKPVWMTEGAASESADLDDDLQVEFIGKAYSIWTGHGFERAYWYGIENNRGQLLDSEDALTGAGVAFNEIRDWLEGATVSALHFQSGVGQQVIRRSGYTGKIVWTETGSTSFKIPAGFFTRYRDLAGNITAIDGGATSIAVGVNAILLETGEP